jgi:hypothetical protein
VAGRVAPDGARRPVLVDVVVDRVRDGAALDVLLHGPLVRGVVAVATPRVVGAGLGVRVAPVAVGEVGVGQVTLG